MSAVLASSLDYEGLKRLEAKIDLALARPRRGKKGAAPDLGDLCAIFQQVRPVVVWLSELSLIPAKVRKAVRLLVVALDAVCA